MFEVQVLVPVADNNGVIFIESHHLVFELHMLTLFNGYSRMPGEIAGGWRSPTGVVYYDTLRAYTVALDSITQGSQLLDLVEFAKAHYSQEAIAIRYLGLFEAL